MNVVRSFVNYAIIRELCDRMRFAVDCAKSHHRVISEGLNRGLLCRRLLVYKINLEMELMLSRKSAG